MAECRSFLEGLLPGDWTAAVPDLDLSVVEVVAHAAEACLWYAIDLAAGGRDLQPVEHRVKTDGHPAEVVRALDAYAAVVAATIEVAPSTARGFHPMGQADPSGFAAMACDEMLVHTWDAGRGLDRSFDPADDLAAAVLRRLFPWVSVEDDPWPQLLWANGRVVLGEQPRLTNWVWHCAPLGDWNGQPPTAVAGQIG